MKIHHPLLQYNYSFYLKHSFFSLSLQQVDRHDDCDESSLKKKNDHLHKSTYKWQCESMFLHDISNVKHTGASQ